MNDITARLITFYDYLLDLQKVGGGKDFAEKIGISTSMFTEISKGRTNAGINVIQKTVLCDWGDVRPDGNWFLTGIGGMLREDSVYTPNPSHHITVKTPVLTNENDNKKDDTHAPPTAPATAPPTINLGVPHVITVDNTGANWISLVNVRARAGYLSGYADPEYIEHLPSYMLPGLNNGTFRAFEIEGDSMKPTLKRNDIVICQWMESLSDIREDRVHVVVTKTEGIVIKRLLNRINEYGAIIGKSDNLEHKHDYPNLNILPEDVVELWYPKLLISADFKAPGDMYKRINDLEAGLHFLLQKAKQDTIK